MWNVGAAAVKPDQSEGCLGFAQHLLATVDSINIGLAADPRPEARARVSPDDLDGPSPFNIPFRPSSPEAQANTCTDRQIGVRAESMPAICHSSMALTPHQARDMDDTEEDRSQSRCYYNQVTNCYDELLLQDNAAATSMFNQVAFQADSAGSSFNFDEGADQAQLTPPEDLSGLGSSGMSQFDIQMIPIAAKMAVIPTYTYPPPDKATKPPTLSNAPAAAARKFTMKPQTTKPYQVNRMRTPHRRRLAAQVNIAGGLSSGMKYVAPLSSNQIAKPEAQRHGHTASTGTRIDTFAHFEEAPGSNMLGQMLPIPKAQTQRQANPKNQRQAVPQKTRWSPHLTKFFKKSVRIFPNEVI